MGLVRAWLELLNKFENLFLSPASRLFPLLAEVVQPLLDPALQAVCGRVIIHPAALQAALSEKPSGALRERVAARYTWRHAAEATLRGYEVGRGRPGAT